MASAEACQRFNRVLAPERAWQELLDQGELRNLTMRAARPDHHGGYVQVQVQPSRRIENGIFLNVNDHYDAAKPSATGPGARAVMEILRENWESSRERSLSMMEQLVRYGDF